jgi:2-polyprenyl-3-methyl-5-hydroxy-6-metoxy-1,4-benzoquinol methylase
MNFVDYYRTNQVYGIEPNDRMRRMLAVVLAKGARRVLDIGCGRGVFPAELRRFGAEAYGVDVFDPDSVAADGWSYTSGDITRGLPYPDCGFDCVTLGEVIEHVPDPDGLLRDIRRVLAPGGWLVLSTPNLVCWANRVLVPLGLQPLFTETSSRVTLGRRWRMLGQGSRAQGHLKVFTHRSLAEILELHGFEVHERRGLPFAAFPWPARLMDAACAGCVPLASILLYVARRP